MSQIDNLVAALGIHALPVRVDSQAKQVLMAAGIGDILMRYLSPGKEDFKEKIWDQAAGALMVEEEGGRVTDLAGSVLDFSACIRLIRNVGVICIQWGVA